MNEIAFIVLLEAMHCFCFTVFEVMENHIHCYFVKSIPWFTCFIIINVIWAFILATTKLKNSLGRKSNYCQFAFAVDTSAVQAKTYVVNYSPCDTHNHFIS